MLKNLLCSETSWGNFLQQECDKPYMLQLEAFLESEFKAGEIVYPPKDQIFQAFYRTPYEQVKVVIVGQDPYHGEGQAHGLAFSVAEGVDIPPSLKNIFKELETDLGSVRPNHGCLSDWTRQGVLLLNATLTVRASQPKSHADRGWETFTDRAIQFLSEREDPLVFVLWGQSACRKGAFLETGKGPHLVLKAAHPSPFSAYNGFFGCRHFSQINAFLKSHGKTPIDWTSQKT